MELMTFTGVALIALLVMVLPALAHKYHWTVIREDWRRPLKMFLGVLSEELGVTIVYCWPGAGTGATGGATPPTAVQASQSPVQSAQVFFADGDTEAIIVHNKGLQKSFPAFLYPMILVDKALGAGADNSFRTQFTFGRANTNQVYMTKAAGAGTGGTYTVWMIFGDGPWLK